MNEELDLEEEVIEIRSLELGDESAQETAGVTEEDLDRVTERVNAIQDNIRRLFVTDDETAVGESEGDPSAAKGDAGTQIPEEEDHGRPDIRVLAGSVPAEVLNAAFSEEEPVSGDESPDHSDRKEGPGDTETSQET